VGVANRIVMDAGGVSGGSVSNKSRYTRITATLDEVDRDLREEEEALLKMRELVMKEIQVLQVEWVWSMDWVRV
jgi:hypothetical protein